MARTYRRDNRGRFSSTGRAGTGRQLAARMVSRGTNRLTRDNAGRITSVGGQGATARGGRLRTAAGNKRATQLARLKGTGGRLRKPISSRPRVSRAEPLMTGGTLASRSSLKRARQKLRENPGSAQRGAVTRANKYAAAARARDTTAKKFGRPAGAMRRRTEERPMAWSAEKSSRATLQKVGAQGGRVRVGKVGDGQSKTAVKRKPTEASVKAAKAERVIERWRSIGEGKTGIKARQSRRVQDRAKTWLIGLAPNATYQSGPKKGQQRTREETIKALSKNLQDKKRVRQAGEAYKRTPISGTYGKMLTSGRLDLVRTRLNKRAAARAAYGYSAMSPNKAETSRAVLKRAQEFAKNPRGNKKLTALSRPRPQQKQASATSRAIQQPASTAKAVASSPRSSGPKLNAFQRSDARYAKRKYGVHSTISDPGRKSQRSPRRTLQSGQRVAITGRTRKQVRQSYAKTVTNKLFDNYNRGLTRNAGPKLRIRKQALYDQFSVFGGSKTVSRSRVTRPRPRRRRP